MKLKKKAIAPFFKSNEIFQKSYPIPWLDNKRLQFDLLSGSIKEHKHLTKIGVKKKRKKENRKVFV